MSGVSSGPLRPGAVVLAVAALCAMQPLHALAQHTALAPATLPTSPRPMPGSTVATRTGGTAARPVLTVTTGSSAGANHSVIDWQGFSIGSNARVEFVQPSAGSTSINRVVTGNPSALFGTLSSNGRLVLVNPAGITVGTGAVIDAAGFTASTLPMCDADATAGAMNFLCGGGSGKLKVDGTITGRAGDVILVGTELEVGASGSLAAHGGRMLLLAGRAARISGRGLEGIVLDVKGSAVNAGRLRGDAVAIFAASLTHSGLIHADAVDTAGGKVVLEVTGEARIAGVVEAVATPPSGGGSVADDGQLARAEAREVFNLGAAFVQDFEREAEQGPHRRRDRHGGQGEVLVTGSACER